MTKNEKEKIYAKLRNGKLQVAAHTIGIDYPDLERILKSPYRREILHRNFFCGQDDLMDELFDEGKALKTITVPEEKTIWYMLTLKGIAWVEEQLQCITFLMPTDYLLAISKYEPGGLR